MGLMPPRRDDEDESSPREDGNHAPRGPSPRWRAPSYDSYDADHEIEADDDPDDAYHGWAIHEAYVKEDEARRHNGEGRVETVKFLSTSRRTSKKRSPPSFSTMTGTIEETTSRTKKIKKLTVKPRMSVKPKEEWGEDFFANMFTSEKPAQDDTARFEQRVEKLEKYQKEELIHRDIVRHRLSKLENMKDFNNICEAFSGSLRKLREDVRNSNKCIALLEESNIKLRTSLHHATAEHPSGNSPTRGTK